MPGVRIGWLVTAALAVGGGAALAWQYHAVAGWRAEVAAARTSRGDLLAARMKHDALVRAAVSEEERQRLQDDHAAVARLRETLAELRARSLTSARAKIERPAATEAAPPVPPAPAEPLTDLLPVAAMHDAGAGSPRAVAETLLWALREGNVEAAARLLVFTPEARTKIEAVLRALPENVRAEHGTPEQMMAFVMAGGVPVTGFQVLDETVQSPTDVRERVRLQDADGRSHVEVVYFRRAENGWQRLVPPGTVEQLAKFLRSPPPASAEKG